LIVHDPNIGPAESSPCGSKANGFEAAVILVAVNRAVLMAMRDAPPECLRNEMPNRRLALTRRATRAGLRTPADCPGSRLGAVTATAAKNAGRTTL